MATTEGTVAPTAFARRAVQTAVESAVITPVVCMFTLVPLAIAGPPFGPFALATYIGLVAGMAGYAAREDPKRVGEIDEPRYLNLVRTVVLLLYFNGIIIVGSAMGYAFVQAGFPQLAFFAAAIVPAVDAGLARLGMPSLGLAGAIILTSAELLGRLISRLTSDSSLAETLRESGEYITDLDSIYGEYQLRLDDAVARWT